MAQIDFKKCSLVIKDAGSNEVEAFFGEGSITWTENTPHKFILDRGLVATGTVRKDDEQPMEVTINASLMFMKSDTGEDITLYEALKGVDAASDWESTSDECEPYATNLEFTFDPDCGSTKVEITIFPKFFLDQVTPDPRGGTQGFTGKCKATVPTRTRATAAP